jgi:hypothetical protein
VQLGEHEIAVSQVAVTPLGPQEIARHSEPWSGEDLAGALPKVLGRFLPGKGRRWPTAVGLPAGQLFFCTRPVDAASELSPESLLQKSLCSPTTRVDDYVVEMTKAKLNSSSAASMAACRKKYLAMVMGALGDCKIRPFRIEPGPAALLRAAAERHRAPRHVRIALRVFLSEAHGLAVMAAGDVPVAWRNFALPGGQEQAAVLSVVRTLQNLARNYGVTEPARALMLHGRPDLYAGFQEPSFGEEAGMRVVCCPGPELSPASMAFGLALGCLNEGSPAFDLSRTLKPQASFRELIPAGDLVLEAVALIAMGLLLWAQSLKIEDARRSVHLQNLRHECLASEPPERLEKEKNDLAQRVEAIGRFLDTRMLWTSYTHDLPARLPDGVKLNTFEGFYELERTGKRRDADTKPRRSLVMRAITPVLAGGAMPREIDAFLQSLRNDPLLRRDFPLVELADIKRTQDFRTLQWLANFTVVCLPAAARTAAPAGGSEPKKARP